MLLSEGHREGTSHRRVLWPASGKKGWERVRVTILLLLFKQTPSAYNIQYHIEYFGAVFWGSVS